MVLAALSASACIRAKLHIIASMQPNTTYASVARDASMLFSEASIRATRGKRIYFFLNRLTCLRVIWQSRKNSFRHMNMCQAQSVSPASLQRICAGISSYSPLHIPQCLKELLKLDQFWILDRFCLVQFFTISNNDPVRDARRENNVDIPSVEELCLVIPLILP